MAADRLTFDPIKHHYFVDGKRVPGVSEILKTVGLGRSYENVDNFYRDRGVATHRAIQLYLKGTLDEDSLDPAIVPYFNQAKDWLIKADCLDNWECETMVYSEEIQVAGTIDLILDEKVYDWKTSKSVDPVTEIQGAFYKVLTGIPNFAAIQLDGSDGPAIEIPYEAGYELVEAVMTLYHKWKKK